MCGIQRSASQNCFGPAVGLLCVHRHTPLVGHGHLKRPNKSLKAWSLFAGGSKLLNVGTAVLVYVGQETWKYIHHGHPHKSFLDI